MPERHFINLTNGIQAIADYGLTDYRFLRIQSTHCEQKRWDDVLASCSDELLMRLALGESCVVYDYGTKGTPRAVWQGLEFLHFCLRRRWFGLDFQPTGRCLDAWGYFVASYMHLDRRTKDRLDYFKPFLVGPGFHLRAVTSATDKDGHKDWHVAELQRAVLGRAAAPDSSAIAN